MTAMKERAAIGTRWRRRRDKTLWKVKQSHRADRIAELVRIEPDVPGNPFLLDRRRLFVSFTDLRTKFEEI